MEYKIININGIPSIFLDSYIYKHRNSGMILYRKIFYRGEIVFVLNNLGDSMIQMCSNDHWELSAYIDHFSIFSEIKEHDSRV